MFITFHSNTFSVLLFFSSDPSVFSKLLGEGMESMAITESFGGELCVFSSQRYDKSHAHDV